MKYDKTEKLIECSTSGGKRGNRTFSLNIENYDKVRKFCIERGIALSKLIDALIDDFLKSQENEDE